MPRTRRRCRPGWPGSWGWGSPRAVTRARRRSGGPRGGTPAPWSPWRSTDDRAGTGDRLPRGSSPQAHRLEGQYQVLEQQIGLDLGPHRTEDPEGDFQVLVEKSALLPAPDAGREVEVAIVDEQRPESVGFGEDVHQGVDVLPRHIDDRQEDRAPLQVGEEAIRVEIIGEFTGEIEAFVQHAHLRQLSRGSSRRGSPGLPGPPPLV